MCVSISVALREVQHHNTVAGGEQLPNSENMLVKHCRQSLFWLRTHYVWVMNILFKNLLDDYYSACSYLQFPYFKVKFRRSLFLKFFINAAPNVKVCRKPFAQSRSSTTRKEQAVFR
jgi:hypothetical protein